MSDNKYYSGASSAFLSGQTWNDVSTAGGTSYRSPNATSWVYAPPNLDAKFALQTTYYVILATASDIAGNFQAGYLAGVSSFTFLYDNQAPSASISFPGPGGAYKPGAIGQATNPLAGTAFDNPVVPPQAGLRAPLPGPGGALLRLSYVLAGTTYYWNNAAVKFDSSTLTSSTAWFETDDNSWVYGSITQIKWPSISYSYLLDVQAIDSTKLGDGSGTGNTVTGTSISFIVDSTSPTVTLTWPAANAAVSSSTVQMTGTDGDDAGGSGVNLIQVDISTGLAGSKAYWNGASWQAGQLWITTTTVNPWIYTIPNSPLAPGNGKLYNLRIQSNDFAGNLFTSQTSTFTYNTTAPTVTITPQAPNNGFYSAVQVSTPLAGTTSPSGAPGIVVSTVSLMLQDLTFPTSYSNGSAWQSGSTSF